MSVMEKSDLLIVAMKRANKAVSAVAEPVKRRGGAKENAELQSTVRTQSRVAVSQAQVRIREAVFTRGAVSSSPSKVGARCVSSARRDLCGGRREISVPTATRLRRPCSPLAADVFALRGGRRVGLHHAGLGQGGADLLHPVRSEERRVGKEC